MELRQLELFVSVVENGSINRAAKQLRLAQPSISESIRKLERHIGTPLLIRSHRGVDLTEAGEVLFERAREILERIDLSVEEARGGSRTPRRLRIGLLGGMVSAGEMTISILTAFRRQNPDVVLTLRELSYADQVEALTSDEVDVAIVRPPYEVHNLATTPLFSEPRVLCLNASHELAATNHVAVSDVTDEKFVRMVRAPSEWASYWALDRERGSSSFVLNDPAVTVTEVMLAISAENAMISAPASSWRMTGSSAGTVRAIPLVDATRSNVVVGHTHRTSDIDRFISCARSVTEELLHVIPDAILLESSTP